MMGRRNKKMWSSPMAVDALTEGTDAINAYTLPSRPPTTTDPPGNRHPPTIGKGHNPPGKRPKSSNSPKSTNRAPANASPPRKLTARNAVERSYPTRSALLAAVKTARGVVARRLAKGGRSSHPGFHANSVSAGIWAHVLRTDASATPQARVELAVERYLRSVGVVNPPAAPSPGARTFRNYLAQCTQSTPGKELPFIPFDKLSPLRTDTLRRRLTGGSPT